MTRFSVSSTIEADRVVGDGFIAGELFHIQRNNAGGATLTPIGRYFAWHPEFFEGFNEHWRVDCFVRKHHLSPQPMQCGTALMAALIRERMCSEPLWLSVHASEELEGKAYGSVFEDD